MTLLVRLALGARLPCSRDLTGWQGEKDGREGLTYWRMLKGWRDFWSMKHFAVWTNRWSFRRAVKRRQLSIPEMLSCCHSQSNIQGTWVISVCRVLEGLAFARRDGSCKTEQWFQVPKESEALHSSAAASLLAEPSYSSRDRLLTQELGLELAPRTLCLPQWKPSLLTRWQSPALRSRWLLPRYSTDPWMSGFSL